MTNLRKIQSFVKRSGRLTPAQEKGLTELWDDYAIEPQGVLDFAKIFSNTHDVVLEIGFGNGSLANPLPCGKHYQFLIF
jgi:tRNA (guanine-N7-)-methyltransferase